MAWFFYYQETPESEWKLADTKSLEYVKDSKFPFTTVLQLSEPFRDDMTREEVDGIQYRGPLYFDFDSDDISTVIPPFKRFLAKLLKLGMTAQDMEIFATGGKGFHITVPMEVLHQGSTSAGFKYLPLVYRELAERLYVDTLDTRIYSMKRGRMFRVANVKRPNGKYKVPITLDEAQNITTEQYEELVSNPRVLPPHLEPTFCSELGSMFLTARDKIKRAMGRRSSRKNAELVVKFDGKFPQTVLDIGKGLHLKPDVGFQKIATQMAITANALGKSEDQMLEICEDLVNNHVSDSARYASPEKRRNELRRMYRYMQDNPCYEFSVGAIVDLLEPGTKVPDLRPINDPYGALDEDEELDIDDGMVGGIRFNTAGIFRKTWNKEREEHEIRRVSYLGIGEVCQLKTLAKGETIAYEVETFMGGRVTGKRRVLVNDFNTANTLQKSLGSHDSASIQVNDAQAKGMLDIMRMKADRTNNVRLCLPREGVDLIKLYGEGEDEYDIVYAAMDKFGVLSKKGNRNYRLECDKEADGPFKSDITLAPKLVDNETTRTFFDSFFSLFSDEIMSRTVGFYTSCFMTQIFRDSFGKFPMMQVFGPAGAGKTSFNRLCTQMFFYKVKNHEVAAGSASKYAIEKILANSASIPLLLDEFKPQEMGASSKSLYATMRNNYTGATTSKGAIRRDVGSSEVIVQHHANVAPLVVMGEQMESMTAILARSIVVSFPRAQEFTQGEGNPTKQAFDFCEDNYTILGQLGHHIIQVILNRIEREDINKLTRENERRLTERIQGSVAARPLYNNAVVLTGLEVLDLTLSHIFGDRYKATIARYKEEVLNNVNASFVENKSEATKVLDTLADMSEYTTNSNLRLVLGEDYGLYVTPDKSKVCLDLNIPKTWEKYSIYMRQQGQVPLYRDVTAYQTAMRQHPSTVAKIARDSNLNVRRGTTGVVRFDLRDLYERERCSEFFDIGRDELKKLAEKTSS